MFGNNNGFNNFGGFGNTKSGSQIIGEIQAVINRILNSRSNGREMIDALNALQSEGSIKIIGKGTNRIVIEVNNDGELKQALGVSSTTPVVYKIPVQISSARLANNREEMAISVMKSGSDQGIEGLRYLLQVSPHSIMIPNTDILMCEKVIPIEFYRPILNEISNKLGGTQGIVDRISGETQFGDPDFAFRASLGNVVHNFLTTNPDVFEQLKKLTSTIDEWFVACDINPKFSPFNYGIKSVNGKGYLCVLDLGALIPKNAMKITCPNCGNELTQIFEWTPGITQSLLNRLNTGGIYTCGNNACKYDGPTILTDTEVFENARQILLTKIYQSGKNYELLDRI